MAIFDYSNYNSLCVCGDIHGEFRTLVFNIKRLGIENSVIIVAGGRQPVDADTFEIVGRVCCSRFYFVANSCLTSRFMAEWGDITARATAGSYYSLPTSLWISKKRIECVLFRQE